MYCLPRLILCIGFLVVTKSQGNIRKNEVYNYNADGVNPLLIDEDNDWVIDDEGCLTPDGGSGDCIPIRQCRPMMEALQSVRNRLTEDLRRQLNAYYCSYTNNAAHVCCPQGPIILRDNGNIQTIPDVSNHRNIGLLPYDCGYLQETGDRIINGQNADLNEFPWMALLSYRTRRGPQFKCGGTIINDRYILTAAHCVKSTESPLLGVRIGEYDMSTKVDCVKLLNGNNKCSEGVQDLAIEEIIAHPGFNTSVLTNDIALIRVSRMNLNVENARPVCLPLGEYRNSNITNVVVTGWGITDVLTGAISPILQKVDLPIVNLQRCQNIYSNQRARITHTQLCAGGKNNKDSCPGDSGGPMHVAEYFNENSRYIQQGIVSFGPRQCGVEGFPGVYTRVAYYMDWILDNIRS